jgi:hypothetical protein
VLYYIGTIRSMIFFPFFCFFFSSSNVLYLSEVFSLLEKKSEYSYAIA